MGVLKALALFLRVWFMTRAHLTVEILALRQQLAVMKRCHKRPRLCPLDRVFWTWLMRLWPRWKSVLIIVQPETVIRWHRQGFRLYWRWKSQARSPGRPPLNRRYVL